MASSSASVAAKKAPMPNGDVAARPSSDDMSSLAQSMVYLDNLASEGLDGIVRINAENENLKKQLREKEERHGVAIDVCNEHLNNKQRLYDDRLAERQAEIDRLRTIHDDLQRQIEKMGKTEQNLKTEKSRQEASVKGAKEMLEKRNQDLRVANAQLDQLRNQTETLKKRQEHLQKLEEYEEKPHNDVKATIEHLTSLWDPLLEAVTSYFAVNLPEAVIKDKVPWQQESGEEGEEANIPLYASNSDDAKFMRVAWVMNKLARLVEQYLLQPCYAFDKPQDFRWLLEKIARTDASAESHIRRTLLKVDERHHLFNKDDRIKLVLKQLRKATNDVFPFNNSLEFESALGDRLYDLCETWHGVQTLNMKVEVGFQSELDYIQNKRLVLRPTSSSASSKAANRSLEQALEESEQGPEVLPGFCLLEPGKEVQVVLGTCVQKARIDRALGELAELSSAAPQRRGTVTKKDGRRRDSIHQDKEPSSRSQDFLRSGAGRGAGTSHS